MAKAPLRETFTGSSRKAFFQVSIVMTGVFFGTDMLGLADAAAPGGPQGLQREPG